ncbi:MULTISPECIES: type IV pilus secretin PilQ [Pseudoalteromonas]|uniref:Secretin n=1 Tax=Pseudoalteromonas ruthenica TaxID=151081 RepID=A0A0F4PTF8_9GAMM|nr:MULTISPECIES: type IV pilus secretin PilQ family protein [Pseudoalteromonas]KJY95084.1 secretin [Pseudoalteromonas ruthenica]KJY98765.1 secretin [Pseudoalteromonas ruthenica]MCF2861960.1 type IV pilus secretin PilQ family protein [Pseudoalteromonas sp. CNAT2-18]MCG7559667.1 type IV pilus secretin PilQ family protein [Pseudoalteromonas sp. CNAT2-18.1]MCG7566624.1 type IV pilus secretin PilQ family protein [Pseudoalteromonas sp. CnMc7-15]|tara:strand:- start:646 stop:2739 length:2094 start_codon:yes stop_codon:yes gene_type:complete
MIPVHKNQGKSTMQKHGFNMNRIYSLVLAFATLFMSSFATAVPLLYDVRYNPLLEGETEIEFVFDEEIYIEPQIQVFSEPARIELFFDEADYEQSLEEVLINKAGVEKVTSEFVNDGFKVTVYLDHLKIYQTRIDKNLFYLHVSDNPTQDAAQTIAEEDEGTSYINRIQALDFRRGEKGEARVLVFLQENMAAIDVREQAGKIVVEFHNTDIIDDLLYQLDVMDFGTVVSMIETFKDGSNSRIVIDTTDAFDYNYQQLDNIFTITVEKDESKRSFLGNGKEYQGRPMSLNFQDISIRAVLQIIADYNGFNLVVSDSVAGNITLRLDGVPWDQALDIVLRVKGLDKRMDGSILMVAPTEELAAREAKELKAKQQVEDLEPLYSEYIQLNYAKAQTFADLLKTDVNSIISQRGSVSVDERTNTLLIKDTAKSIENVRRMIENLDVPVKQVVIESRMVTVRDNVQEDLGIRWGFSDQQDSDGISGNLDGANAIANGQRPSIGDRLNVNLPIANPAGSIGMHVAKLADGTLIDLELTALEQENKGEIIASPRITTANQKKARIEQGTEIPYVQAASSGATTVTFKKAVLSLEVTPHITPDNKVILDLAITQDTRGDTVDTPTGPATAIDTQRIETQVLVENGQTVVLGGIYQQQIINSASKVPLLGDIPYLGYLFRSTSERNEKRELLIFVTPKIMVEDSI